MKPKPCARVRQYPEDSGDAAYIELRDYPADGPKYGIVAKTVDVHDLIDDYSGPRLAIDFDIEGRPIGIEIIYLHRTTQKNNFPTHQLTSAGFMHANVGIPIARAKLRE